MGKILESKGLSFDWKRGQPWMQQLDLSLEGGHIYGLLGRNGAGKTTLIKLLCGCLRPNAGETVFVGANGTINVADRDPRTLSEIVFVAENSDLPPLSIENFGLFTGKLYPRYSHQRYGENLAALEVPRQGMISQLSFGQRRKVHTAFALATDASVVFLDEPTNGLDITSQIVLRKLLVSHLSPDRCLIVSTHHIREFEQIIDQTLILENGKIIAKAPTEELQALPDFGDLETWYARLIGVTPPSQSARA